MTNGWTPKRRMQQSTKIREWKPWIKSTGPTTHKGKARSSQNAYKHGYKTLKSLNEYQPARKLIANLKK